MNYETIMCFIIAEEQFNARLEGSPEVRLYTRCLFQGGLLRSVNGLVTPPEVSHGAHEGAAVNRVDAGATKVETLRARTRVVVVILFFFFSSPTHLEALTDGISSDPKGGALGTDFR